MNILPDRIYEIPIEDGVLRASPEFDIIHRWKKLGFSLMRYWDAENQSLHNVAMEEKGIDALVAVGFLAIDRDTLTNGDMWPDEHETYIRFQSQLVDDSWLE